MAAIVISEGAPRERGWMGRWLDRRRIIGAMDEDEGGAIRLVRKVGARSVGVIVSMVEKDGRYCGRGAYLVGVATQCGFDCLEAMPMLRKVLFREVDPICKRAAAIALAAIGNEEAFIMLKDALHSDSSVTKQAAAVGMGKVRGRFAEKAREELEYADRTDANRGVQIEARRSLRSMPPPETV